MQIDLNGTSTEVAQNLVMSADHSHDHGSSPPSDVYASTIPSTDAQANEVFRVTGMDCSEEVAAIERTLKPVPGVLGVQAEIVASKVTVFHDGKLSRSVIAEAINKSGVTVQDEKERRRRPSANTILVATSGIATGVGLLLQWLGFKDGWQPDAASLVAIVTGGWLVIPKALRSLRSLSLDMNVLMTVAVLGAVAIGEHAEGAAVAFLFSLSELLESWSVGRARRAIEALMELTPDTALVKRAGEWREVAATEVQPGEIFLVKPGQKAPLDGEVVNGNSSMDQSPITGESIPVEKKPGDTVFAGTINAEGVLEVRTTKAAEITTVARIIKMVEKAQQQRAPAQRFVDTFAKYYTPAVMVLAVILAIAPPLLFAQSWDTWIYRALVLLVIACPCALVISTPVSVVSGLTAMARAGVLIKGGAYLEALAGLRALAMDKTGTITEGKPRVQEVIPWNHTPANEILRIAASLDARFEPSACPSRRRICPRTGNSIGGHRRFSIRHRARGGGQHLRPCLFRRQPPLRPRTRCLLHGT